MLKFQRVETQRYFDAAGFPGRTLGLVAGAFELLLPVLVQAPPLLGHIRRRGQIKLAPPPVWPQMHHNGTAAANGEARL